MTIDSKKLQKMKLETLEGLLSFSDIKTDYVLLFFYPKDSTPGCTVESQDFSKLKNQLLKKSVTVLGVSRDSIKSHEKFRDKFELTVDLISDSEEELCQIFDVIKEKNMYGKKVMGIERSTFLLDKKLNLVQEWRKVKAEGHAAEVLDFIKKRS